MPEDNKKPVDRWLGLGAIAVGIGYFWIEKTPINLIISLCLVFILLFHPIWNFWWIEKQERDKLHQL